MNDILLPTDFSKNSLNAIDYAMSFFNKYPCNFYLLHVSEIANYVGGETPMIPSKEALENTVLSKAKSNLQEIITKIKESPLASQHNFIPIVSYNYFIDEVRKQIKEKKIDIVIMGTKGATGLKKIIVGSNTGDLITKVKIPVIAVPEKARFKEPNEIAFPTDYNLFYPTKILSDIAEISKMFNATLRVLHVAKREEDLSAYQKENKAYLDDFFHDRTHSFHRITNKKIAAGVECFVESREIDMLVMIAKNLTLFQQIIFKPLVEEISYHIKVPFLVLHED